VTRFIILIFFVLISTPSNAQSCEKQAAELRSKYDMSTQRTRATSVTLLWRNQAELTLYCRDVVTAVTHFDVKFSPDASEEFIKESLIAILKRFRPKDWQATLRRVSACSKKLVLADYAEVNPETKASVLCSTGSGVTFSFYPTI
jgi:hypothetical protein